MYILLDVDHTISNSFWRDPMIGSATWDEYHAASIDDKPFKKVVTLINSLAAMNYNIIVVTGRNEKFRALTLKWFLKNQVHIDEMLMRPNDVFLKNAEMKTQLINERFGSNYNNIQFALEDNEDACIAYMNLGITSLQIRNISGESNVATHDKK
jgi:uncharacterized HAD superfamily protein